MKKTVALLAMMLLLSSVPNTGAAKFSYINADTYATVVEVLDANALKVRLWGDGAEVLVKIIGIAETDDAAFTYLSNQVAGTLVWLEIDPKIKTVTGVWNNVRVIKGDVDIAAQVANANLPDLSPAGADDNYVERININTANYVQLSQFLGIAPQLAYNITRYRGEAGSVTGNPFSDVYELKFVNAMTREIFDAIKDRVCVSTNLLKATATELSFLSGAATFIVNAIVRYRDGAAITYPSDLLLGGAVSEAFYKANKPYISVLDDKTVAAVNPDSVVAPLNSATDKQYSLAGISTVQIAAVKANKSEFTFKTIGELNKFATGAIPQETIDWVEDNLPVPPYREYLNLNLATFEQIRQLGVDYLVAEKVYAAQQNRLLRSWANVPAELSEFDSQITLYTNINKASKKELMSLNAGITEEFADTLIELRNASPFGSMNEVFNEFYKANKLQAFYTISNFIVVR
ncbi:hypothetical protein FACS189490_09240 [Clostridia bacterium]|nr:hypothetical protein FACS189490_09240 [Clostridia bacterium]